MMKTLYLNGAKLALIAGLVCAPLLSAYAEAVTGSASVVIQEQIVASEGKAISFGAISVPDDDETVTIAPDGTITTQSGTTSTSGTVNAAEFSVVGTANANVILSFENGTLSGPGIPILVDNFTHNAGPAISLDDTGNLAFNVGADLSLHANQSAGSYSGTYSISVSYQ